MIVSRLIQSNFTFILYSVGELIYKLGSASFLIATKFLFPQSIYIDLAEIYAIYTFCEILFRFGLPQSIVVHQNTRKEILNRAIRFYAQLFLLSASIFLGFYFIFSDLKIYIAIASGILSAINFSLLTYLRVENIKKYSHLRIILAFIKYLLPLLTCVLVQYNQLFTINPALVFISIVLMLEILIAIIFFSLANYIPLIVLGLPPISTLTAVKFLGPFYLSQLSILLVLPLVRIAAPFIISDDSLLAAFYYSSSIGFLGFFFAGFLTTYFQPVLSISSGQKFERIVRKNLTFIVLCSLLSAPALLIVYSSTFHAIDSLSAFIKHLFMLSFLLGSLMLSIRTWITAILGILNKRILLVESVFVIAISMTSILLSFLTKNYILLALTPAMVFSFSLMFFARFALSCSPGL